jgi:hypothetical protein
MKSVMYLVTFLMLPFAVSPVHAQATRRAAIPKKVSRLHSRFVQGVT